MGDERNSIRESHLTTSNGAGMEPLLHAFDILHGNLCFRDTEHARSASGHLDLGISNLDVFQI